MKRLSLLLGLLAIFAVPTVAEGWDVVPGQIIVDIKHEFLPITPALNGQDVIVTSIPSLDSLNELYQVHTFQKIVDDSWSALKGFYLLKFPDSLDVNLVHSSFSADVHIHLVGLTGFRYPDVTPSDYYFPEQWGLRRMKCPEAWRYTNGSSSIIIQIIDGGTDYGHPDLIHNIWQNTDEDADNDGHTIEWNSAEHKWVLDLGDFDGYDADHNGYPDDLVGWDFWNIDNDPQPTHAALGWDDHGDKTAGTAAAVTDNRISSDEANWVCWYDTGTVAGTSWFSKIMIARIYYANPLLDIHAIQAIHYARNKGARIISMSWGSSVDDAALHAALDSAYDEGILLVASAGNDSSEAFHYPAVYSSVIAVAGTDSNDVKAAHSNWGTWVDICAPWSNIAPDRDDPPNWSYYCYDDDFSGTSASAPFVAGVAALVWACDTFATNVEVRNALESTADSICGLPGNQGQPWCAPFNKLGHGRVNALEAVKVFRPIPFPPGDCTHNWVIELDDAVYILNYLFQDGPHADPVCIADTNADGIVNLGDALVILDYLFRGGPPPQDGCI
jgi:subtilisin family serine protease